MKFGISKELITPAVSTSIIGFGTVYGQPFENIHDDIYCRTLLLCDDQGKQSIIMGFDLLFHDSSLQNTLRDYAVEKYHIDRDCLIVNYSHTHFAPAVWGYDFVWTNPEYEAFVIERAKMCIDRAYLNIREGTIEYGAVEGMWNMNRRLPDEDGVYRLRPNIDGERDLSLYFLCLKDNDGRVRGILANYACHPSNFNQYHSISSEYPGRLCAALEYKFYGATAVFCQGAGADTKLRVGAKSSERFTGINEDELNETALSMAEAIAARIARGGLRDVPLDLRAKSFTVKLPFDLYPKSYFENLKNVVSKGTNVKYDKTIHTLKEYPSSLMWACADLVLEKYDTMPDYLTLECGMLCLNSDFLICTMGGEPSFDVKTVVTAPFVEVGKTALFFGYSDAIAYIPSDRLLKEGGYEAGAHSVEEYRLKGKFSLGVNDIYRKAYGDAAKELGVID